MSLPAGWSWEPEPDWMGRQGWRLYGPVYETRKRRVRKRKCHADIFPNGVWFTWDSRGVGGENDVNPDLEAAKQDVLEALVRQGWM